MIYCLYVINIHSIEKYRRVKQKLWTFTRFTFQDYDNYTARDLKKMHTFRLGFVHRRNDIDSSEQFRQLL
jgi:valyl-tRNA synthetase